MDFATPRQRAGRSVTTYLLLAIGAIWMVLPFAWMLSTALKLPGATYLVPLRWLPSPVTTQNFQQAFTTYPFLRWLGNSTEIGLLNAVGQVLACSLAAYPLAKIRFRGSIWVFWFVLVTLLLPAQATLVPFFIEMSRGFGWNNTTLPLIVPSLFGGSYGVFMLRQFFANIPTELVEAASLDGLNHLGIYWRIFVPLSFPALSALAIITFFNSWNNFLMPLVFLHSISIMTVPVGLMFFDTQAGPQWGLLMAGSLVSMIPLMILFVGLQRYFVASMTSYAIKG